MGPVERAVRSDTGATGAAAAVIASREARLFIALTGLFITNALIAEFVGVKIFALEDTLGIDSFDWRLFGQGGSLSFTAGVMLWPVVFIMTDVINEHFGVRGVRLISWLAVAFIVYAFLFAYVAIGLAPAKWWLTVGSESGVPDMQAAFATIFGQGMWTIGGSVTAFLVGPADRRRRVPAHPCRDRRAVDLAAGDRLDGDLAADRQLHRALHRIRARSPALAHSALSRGRHGQLPLQDVDGDRVDPASLSRSAPDPRLPGRTRGEPRLMARPRTPEISVDVVIELEDRPGRPIVLIRRGSPPAGHALPGGFVDIGETVEQAAVREAREETGLDVNLGDLLGIYSDPARDPRGHTVSIVYVATAGGDPAAGDDAAAILVTDPESAPPLAFDHDRILGDYLALAAGRRFRAQIELPNERKPGTKLPARRRGRVRVPRGPGDQSALPRGREDGRIRAARARAVAGG